MRIRMKRLLVLCILLFAGCSSDVRNCVIVPNITAVRDASEVGMVLQKVLNGYGLSSYTYSTPLYDPRTGLWMAETRLNTGYTLVTYVNDSDLGVHDVLFRAPIPDLDVPPGSLKVSNSSCEKSGRIQVDVFEDPYCPGCIASAGYESELIDNFASDPIDFRWRYFPTHSLYPGGIIENYGNELVELAAEYYICAEEQGMLSEFKACNNALFNDRTKDAGEEIPSFGQELEECARNSAMDIGTLNLCLNRTDIANRTASDISYANSIGIDSTPSTVVNCMYRQRPTDLRLTLCTINESFKGCK